MEAETHNTIRELWLGSDLTQEEIAVIVGVTPDSLSRYINETFTPEERRRRLSTTLSNAQAEVRTANPSWYTGPGRSVPLKILVYCQRHGLTQLPPKKSIVFVNGDSKDYSTDNLLMLDTKDAKKLRELRLRSKAKCHLHTLIPSQTDTNTPQ